MVVLLVEAAVAARVVLYYILPLHIIAASTNHQQ